MKSTLETLAGGALSLLVPAWLLVAPVSAQQQPQQQSQPRGESRGGGEGRATPHSGQGPSGGGGGATTRSSGGGGSQSGGGGNQSSGSGGSQSSGGASTGGYSGGSRMRDSDGGSRRDSGGSSGYAVPRNSGGDTSNSGGGRASGGSSSGSTGSTAASAPAERERGTRSADGARGGERRDGQDVPSYARPREGRPVVGTAVPRGSVAPPVGGGGGRYIPGGFYGPGGYYGGYYGAAYGYYDPWAGYGGYGGYYGGYYDPWYGGYPAYQEPSAGYGFDEGRLRLKIKPRNAEVYVDGYYAGVVDDFDGIFQRLHLESGPHRIEIRALGFETLNFDVMIAVDRTTTYEAVMKPVP